MLIAKLSVSIFRVESNSRPMKRCSATAVVKSVEMRSSMATKVKPLTTSDTRHFYEILEYEFNRAARYSSDITLMFIKIDQLDEIARLHGQMLATRLLRKIERLICHNIRSTDREFIHEIDEFMLILPNTPLLGANHMVPKLKRLIESCPFANKEGALINLVPKFSLASYAHEMQTNENDDKLAGNGP
jgi:diguanylate cyclase (GGDEF)-like protein